MPRIVTSGALHATMVTIASAEVALTGGKYHSFRRGGFDDTTTARGDPMAAERDAGGRTSFKRLNFFKGLVTTESDWIDREQYRIDKLRFHTRWMHGPGVVRGFLGDLVVQVRGDLSVEVQPGCAVDGQGNQII